MTVVDQGWQRRICKLHVADLGFSENQVSPGRRFKCISHGAIKVISMAGFWNSAPYSPTVLALHIVRRGNILSFFNTFYVLMNKWWINYYELIFSTLLKAGWNNGKHSKIKEVLKAQTTKQAAWKQWSSFSSLYPCGCIKGFLLYLPKYQWYSLQKIRTIVWLV